MRIRKGVINSRQTLDRPIFHEGHMLQWSGWRRQSSCPPHCREHKKDPHEVSHYMSGKFIRAGTNWLTWKQINWSSRANYMWVYHENPHCQERPSSDKRKAKKLHTWGSIVPVRKLKCLVPEKLPFTCWWKRTTIHKDITIKWIILLGVPSKSTQLGCISNCLQLNVFHMFLFFVFRFANIICQQFMFWFFPH